MLNRCLGVFCVVFMLGANVTLFVRDVLPEWRAGDPPVAVDLAPGEQARRAQTGIYDERNRSIGTSWTITEARGDYVQVSSRTMLTPISLPNGIVTAPVRVDTDMKYRVADGLVDELTMLVHGLPILVNLRGMYVPPNEFACRWRLGSPGQGGRSGEFVLDAGATRALGNVLRPFSRLPDLYVGQTWRLELINPLLKVIPGLQVDGLLEAPEIARVTRRETIQHAGAAVETLVVEARRTRAWVEPGGTVLRQEIDLPLLGTLTMRDEPFDEWGFEQACRWRTGD
jgi:hypothetical protein